MKIKGFLIFVLILLVGCAIDISLTNEEKCNEWCFSNVTTFTIGGKYHSGYNNDKCNSYCKGLFKEGEE